MGKPLVTIAIISYNYSSFITKAIDSALAQTYGGIEIIVIDDGSTDNTLKKIQPYADRLRIIRNNHNGLIATRNSVVKYAHGEYIIQLDADDYLDGEYVTKTVARALETEADIVYTQARIFGRVKFETNYTAYDKEKLKHDNFIHASSLVRKNILTKNSYDPYLEDKGYEDWDLFLGLCMNGAKAVLVDEPLLFYRKHDIRESRSDKVTGYNDVLARHHIWSKQNQKHPEEFWYFSSQIKILLDTIELYHTYNEQEKSLKEKRNEITTLKKRITKLEKRDVITIAKKLLSSIKRLGKKY